MRLTDDKLLQLSRVLSTDQMRILAIKGLEMEGSIVEKHFEDNPRDIRTAAYKLLIEWRNSKKDKKTAYIKMCDALEKVNMPMIINELQ